MSKINSTAIEENLFTGLQRKDQIIATGQNIVPKHKPEAAVLNSNSTNQASQSSIQLQTAQYQQPKE